MVEQIRLSRRQADSRDRLRFGQGEYKHSLRQAESATLGRNRQQVTQKHCRSDSNELVQQHSLNSPFGASVEHTCKDTRWPVNLYEQLSSICTMGKPSLTGERKT